jgi:GNAT superfamily N-acetyltransferase
MRPPAILLRREPVRDLREHAAIPSRFEAWSVMDVPAARDRHGGWRLVERPLAAPYRKDYDEFEDPLGWTRQFDTAGWVLIACFVDGQRVGGAIVAARTPGVDLLEGRTDLAVLWDLRVAPALRRRGVATALFAAAQAWARENGCVELKVETQNTNPAACRFYQRRGCVLSEVRPGAYPELPGDVQLIWRLRWGG